MNLQTKFLLITSALFMAIVGLALSFLPQEILSAISNEHSPALVVLLQCMGALYLGFGFNNWMSRGVIMGGIYARPLATANFVHFLAGALALLKQARHTDEFAVTFYSVTIVYIVFALWFGATLFTDPLKDQASSS